MDADLKRDHDLEARLLDVMPEESTVDLELHAQRIAEVVAAARRTNDRMVKSLRHELPVDRSRS